jgi:CubicO group peptidase (beta-lactamase class C family)
MSARPGPHSAGLPRDQPGRHWAETGLAPGPNPPALAPDELVRRFAALPLMHQPSERRLYHTGYDNLGALIARVAGRPLAAFLAERIFAPPGMRDTAFAVPGAGLDRLAACYEAKADAGLVVCGEGRSAVHPSGSTGLVSTAEDYPAFGRMMLRLGRHGTGRVLARPTVEAMTTDRITSAQKAISPSLYPEFRNSHGWGFGVSVTTRRDGPAASPGSFGWQGGFGTTWWADPREDLVAVLMLQRLWDETVTGLHADFRTLTCQASDD